MAKDYFIVTGKGLQGPYDLVMLVRKIRNGSVKADTAIQQDSSGQPVPAAQWPELAEFLSEKSDASTSEPSKRGLHRRNLVSALQGGWRFLQRNQLSTVLAGIWVLTVIVMMGFTYFGLPDWTHPIAYIVCFIFSHFLLSCYLFITLRMTRGQPVGSAYLFSKVGPIITSMLFSSAFVSLILILGLIVFTNATTFIVAMIGLFVVTVPGLIILTFYAFTPLLMLDQDFRFWDAMESSRKAVMKSGVENIGVLYGLFVINFLGGLFIILPMAITLPITMGTLAEIYDESF